MLNVETGQGGADSESFCSVAFATTYHANMGNAAWAALASDTVREQVLRRATVYMEEVYRLRWAGYRQTDTQALSWPRHEVPRKDSYTGILTGDWGNYYESDTVPIEVQRACAELALRASAGELAPDLDRPTTSETVGPLSVTYAVGTRQYVRYRAIDNLLAPLLSGSGMSLKIVRA